MGDKFLPPEMIGDTIVPKDRTVWYADNVVFMSQKQSVEMVNALRNSRVHGVYVIDKDVLLENRNRHLSPGEVSRPVQAGLFPDSEPNRPCDTTVRVEPPTFVQPSAARTRVSGFKLKIVPGAKQHYTPAPDPAPEILLPPGCRIAAIANFILTKGAYQRYVAPQIADMQFEYIEAISRRDERRAKWIRVRGYGLIFWSLFRSVLASLTTWFVRSAK